MMEKRFLTEGGAKPLFWETLQKAKENAGKYRVLRIGTIQSLYHFYPILH